MFDILKSFYGSRPSTLLALIGVALKGDTPRDRGPVGACVVFDLERLAANSIPGRVPRQTRAPRRHTRRRPAALIYVPAGLFYSNNLLAVMALARYARAILAIVCGFNLARAGEARCSCGSDDR